MSRAPLAVAILLTLAVFVGALSPIRSWDYFWHLATGNWILDNGTLPRTDPFSVGTDRIRWVDGAWLFQIAIAAIHRAGSHIAVSLTRAVFTAALFLAIFIAVHRRTGEWTALLLCAIAAWGAWHRLDARPETAGVACAAIAVVLLQRNWTRWYSAGLAYGVLTLVWVNLHPSALLAPLLSGIALVSSMRGGAERNGRIAALVGALAGLMVNPWGLDGIRAPLGLARQVETHGFVNLEWLPSDPRLFPLLYIVAAAAFVLIVRDRMRSPFESLLLIVLALLAMRWVRNHAFFFVLMPLLLAPMAGRVVAAIGERRRMIPVIAVASLVLSLSPLLARPPRPGVEWEKWPGRSAAMIEALELKGNVFNADQFGGFLLWSFYPERRVLIDGRNELYGTLIPRLLEARRNGRAWTQLIRDYDLRIAVEEHAHRPLEVSEAGTGTVRYSSPSLAYFPRAEWALIAVDPASMLFVRRDAADPDVISRYEYVEWRPDLVDPAREVRDRERYEMERSRGEIELRIALPIS